MAVSRPFVWWLILVFFVLLLSVIYDRLFLIHAQFLSVLNLRIELNVTVPSRGTHPCVFYGCSGCFLDFRLLSPGYTSSQPPSSVLRMLPETAHGDGEVLVLGCPAVLVGGALQHPLALLRHVLPGLAL